MVTFVDSEMAGGNGASTSITYTRTYTPLVGDLEVLIVIAGETASESGGSITGPSGWVELFSTSLQAYPTTPTRWGRTAAWYRFYESGDPSPTVDSTQDGGYPGQGGAIACYRGVSALRDFETSVRTNYNAGATSEVWTATAPTVGAADSVLLLMATGGEFPASTDYPNPPSGWEGDYATGTPYDAPGAVWFGHKEGSGTGAEWQNINSWRVVCLASFAPRLSGWKVGWL
jgi:hypothetical protein